MASILFEDRFVTAILEGKLTFEQLNLSNFSTTWLTHRNDLYEWIKNYKDTNRRLPDTELTLTRYPDFQIQRVEDSPEELISALNHNSLRSRLYTDIQSVTRLIQNGEKPDKIIAMLRKQTASYELETGENDVFDFASKDFKEGVADFKERKQAFETQGIIGIPTGLGRDFDNYLNGGLYKQMLYGAVGISGIGKSWIALVHSLSAFLNGKTPMYFGLEGIPAIEYHRLLSVATGVSNSQIMGGSLPEEAFYTARDQVIEQATRNGQRFLFSSFGKRSKYTTELFHKRLIQFKPDLAIIDYLQMLDAMGNFDGKWQMLLDVSRDMKVIAQAEGIPVVAVLQSDIFGENASELTMGNIAGSKGMPRDFDFAWGYTKVKGKQYLLRTNSIKARYSGDNAFKALYRTGWDTGKIEFIEHIMEDGGAEF